MRIRRVLLVVLLSLRGFPWLWDRLAATMDNVRLLEGMSRPWWLYRAAGRVPASTVERRSPQPVTSAEVELCERLTVAFAKATSGDRSDGPSGIWGWIVDTHHRQLVETLQRGDALALARLLASMFQEEFVSGIMGDAGIKHHESRFGSRLLSLRSLDCLVSLAEAVGVVPVETAGQGQAGLAFQDGLAHLLARIDEALGFRIDFPNVGAPYGLDIDGRLITQNTPEQIYAALRLDQARCNHLSSRPEDTVDIVEIGGGYGGMCYWFLCMRPSIARYTIVDLPITSVLQGYFLAQALGPDVVSLFGEPPAQVRLLPDSALEEVDAPFDIMVNKDGMPEMPYATMAGYLEWGRRNCDGLFFSYNQEARAEFHKTWTQGVVPEAIERIGGFTRTRRDHSWLRRGYAEEIYIPSDASRPTAGLRPARKAGDAQPRGGLAPH
jgi:hypothetical protein